MRNPTILDDVFEKFVNGAGLFKDREVLRHDYLPERLPHREDQIRLLGETIAPVLKDARCSNVFIYGKTGTGKTTGTKYVLSHLEMKAKEYGSPVRFCYVNCRMTGSEYRVFASLSLSVGMPVPFTGLSVSGLSICSALAAAEHGDARRALDLLRVAGEVAERKGAKLITEEHVRDAEKHIEHNRVVEALTNLTLHSKLALLSVYHLGKSSASTGEIYDLYNELCGELGVGLLTQRRLGTLISELDAMGLLNAKVVSMGRYGRTKKIRLEISKSILKA